MDLIKEYLVIINYFKRIFIELNKTYNKEDNESFNVLINKINNSKNYSNQEKIIKSFLREKELYLVDKEFFYEIKIIDINYMIKKSIGMFLGNTLDKKGKELDFILLINDIKLKIKETHNFLFLDNLYSDIINDRIIRNTIEHNNKKIEIGNNIPLNLYETKEILYRLKKSVNVNREDSDKIILEILGEYKTDFKIDLDDFEHYITRAFSFISILFLVKSEIESQEKYEIIKLIYLQTLNYSPIFWDSTTRHLTFLYFNRRNEFYKKSLKEIVQIMYPKGNIDENKIICK